MVKCNSRKASSHFFGPRLLKKLRQNAGTGRVLLSKEGDSSGQEVPAKMPKDFILLVLRGLSLSEKSQPAYSSAIDAIIQSVAIQTIYFLERTWTTFETALKREGAVLLLVSMIAPSKTDKERLGWVKQLKSVGFTVGALAVRMP